jgi:tetratricopeptide (TPR) repeat protein
MACLIAIDYNTNSRPAIILKPKPFAKVLIATAAIVTCVVYLSYVFAPVSKSTSEIRRAEIARMSGQFERAHKHLEKAAADDTLSPSALSIDGRLYVLQYEMMLDRDRNLLLRAESCLKGAIERESVEFKNFERLTDVYRTLAETSIGREKTDWLDKAYKAASQAVERYPGCGRLHFKLAQNADQLGKTDIAVEHYKKAIEIEDEYRAQFRQIYPERQDVVSRIDKNMYLYAKERVEELAGKYDN